MRKNIKHIARVSLFAFLLNALLPFFAVYDVPRQSSAKEMSSLFGEKILICTGDGFKWVKWADLEKEGKHLPSSHYKCPLCYLAAHGLKDMLTPGAVALANMEMGDAVYAVYDDLPAAHTLRSPFLSRAPPYSSFS